MYCPIENKVVGETISKLRLHRNKKAREIANYLELSESAYTKYERGESAITIPFINKIARFFDIHPVELIQYTSENIIENIHHADVTAQPDERFANFTKQMIEMMARLIEFKDKQIEHGNLQIASLIEIIKVNALKRTISMYPEQSLG
jgi:transcriptional regulator with XRE-family HTH domain